MNGKVYLPTSCACADAINATTIRCFPTRPSRPSSSSSSYYSYAYYDFYHDNHYLYTTGTANYYYNSTLPSCSLNSRITNDIYYRHDMPQILLMFVIISLIGFYLPYKIFMKLFKKV